VLEAARVQGRGTVEHGDNAVGGSLERAGDDLVRAAVAAHGVDGNPYRHGLRDRSGERLDLATLVRLAGRAHAVGPLRLAAGRAHVDARRLDAVLGTALVAAGLRGLSLRDSHAAGEYS
jgi:hypothetical protein